MEKEKIEAIKLCYQLGKKLPDNEWRELCRDHGLDEYDLIQYSDMIRLDK